MTHSPAASASPDSESARTAARAPRIGHGLGAPPWRQCRLRLTAAASVTVAIAPLSRLDLDHRHADRRPPGHRAMYVSSISTSLDDGAPACEFFLAPASPTYLSLAASPRHEARATFTYRLWFGRGSSVRARVNVCCRSFVRTEHDDFLIPCAIAIETPPSTVNVCSFAIFTLSIFRYSSLNSELLTIGADVHRCKLYESYSTGRPRIRHVDVPPRPPGTPSSCQDTVENGAAVARVRVAPFRTHLTLRGQLVAFDIFPIGGEVTFHAHQPCLFLMVRLKWSWTGICSWCPDHAA